MYAQRKPIFSIKIPQTTFENRRGRWECLYIDSDISAMIVIIMFFTPFLNYLKTTNELNDIWLGTWVENYNFSTVSLGI